MSAIQPSVLSIAGFDPSGGALSVLKQAHDVHAVKIGVVQNGAMLSSIIKSVLEHWPSAQIVWDPVIQSTSGFQFFRFKDLNELLPLLKRVDLVTPNLDEAEQIFDQSDLSKMPCAVLLTGIQTDTGNCQDRLFADGRCTIFQTKSHQFKKHGSGCVLSTGIACGLARGLVLTKSIEQSAQKTQRYLKSNSDLLGKHAWT